MSFVGGIRCIAAAFLMVFAIGTGRPLSAAPIQVSGSGVVSGIPIAPGTVRTGTVEVGDTLAFSFAFDPTGAPLLFNGGAGFQVYGPEFSDFSASVGDFTYVPGGGIAPVPVVTLGTGFRGFAGQPAAVPVLNQQFLFSGFASPGLPFVTSATATVTFSLTSTFRQDLNGATPTLANLRDPREAAVNRFEIFVRENGRGVGYVEGSFTASFAAAVPEPQVWALVIVGFGAIGGAMRSRPSARGQTTT